MKIFTSAFWKDAIERVGSTFLQALLGVVVGTGVASSQGADLGKWTTWSPITFTTLAALIKVMIAGLYNPSSGASFGTSVPSDNVVAVVNPKTETTEAGNAASLPTGTPVAISADVPRQFE